MVAVSPDLDLGDVDPRLPSLEVVAEVRKKFWASGYRPLAVWNFNWTEIPENDRGKRPAGAGWERRARRDPPEAVNAPIDSRIRNTGVLCDGFRFIDLDIDDPDIAEQIRKLAFAMLGEVTVRYRYETGRCLIPYRAAVGAPGKRSLPGRDRMKIEVLGFGQQAVVHGIHNTRTPLFWAPTPLEDVPAETLPAVTEEQLTAFLKAAAPLYGADPAKADEKASSQENADGAASEPEIPSCDIAAALHWIPNNDGPNWEDWNRMGMAVWYCTRGSKAGKELWRQWSAKNPCHQDSELEERWAHYFQSPPTQTGYQKLASMATAAVKAAGGTGFVSPSQIIKQAAADAAKPGKFRILKISDLRAIPRPKWLIRQILVENSFAAIYGPPKSLKSFMVLDFAMHLATGLMYRGTPIQLRNVLYVAAEGSAALGKRVDAWLEEHNIADEPETFRVVPMVVNLSKESEARALIADVVEEQLRDGFNPDLVVVDTLARCSAGADENSAKEMGVVIDNGSMIQRELGTALLVVHHSGKNAEKGLRGSSALFGAVDTLLQVIREGRDISLLVESHKDAEDGFILKYKAKRIELATCDEYGEPETSLVLQPVENIAPGDPAASLSEQAQKALAILRGLVRQPSAPFHPSKPEVRCALLPGWKEECKRVGLAQPGAESKVEWQAFDRAHKALLNESLIEEDEGPQKNRLVWLTEQTSSMRKHPHHPHPSREDEDVRMFS